VAETLDNGKPIRESRDVDVPLAAAHFFYYAGWADKLEFAGLGPAPAPLGVAAQIIPVELPLADGGVEDRPGPRGRQHGGLKPAETTPLTALLLADILQQADLPAGVVNIITGDGSTGVTGESPRS
jgi:acyl-CoA reductase-like NAD-dependent aldehyde dehydrogenase